MTSSQLAITLSRAKTLLEVEGGDQDGLLSVFIEKTEQWIIDNCNLDPLADGANLPAGLLGALEDIVVIKYNQMGLEGLESRSEGSISNSLMEELPKSIKSVLARHRKLRW